MNSNIYYLEKTDVTPNAELKSYVTQNKPVVVLCQSLSCGHCTTVKPTYQQLADMMPSVRCCTIQMEERALTKELNLWYPDMMGVPCFLGFDKNGKFQSVYNGDRSLASLKQFCSSL